MGGIVEAVSWGLLAGVVGTAAQTLSEKIEASFTKRPDSLLPAQVGAKLTGPPLRTGADAVRLNWTVHWAHGIAMGAIRGLLGVTALSALTASIVHFPLVWGGDVMLYATLGLAPVPWKWRGKELATDLLHKGVLSVVTSLVFIALY
jgi:hypothetical protein